MPLESAEERGIKFVIAARSRRGSELRNQLGEVLFARRCLFVSSLQLGVCSADHGECRVYKQLAKVSSSGVLVHVAIWLLCLRESVAPTRGL